MVGKSRTNFVLLHFGAILVSPSSAILVACRGCQSLRKPTGKTINANATIDNLLAEIENGGADAVLARTGYAEVSELAVA